MTLQDDIIATVTQSWQDPLHSPLASALSYSYAIFYFIAIIIGAFIAVRAMRRYSQYAGKGTPHGPFAVNIMGEGEIHINLSKNDWFEEEHFNKIKKMEKEYQISFQEFKEEVQNGTIYIYDAKVTDHSKTWSLKEMRDMTIITNGKLQDDDFSIISKQGRFSLTSSILKEYPRTATAYPKPWSRNYTMNDPFGKKRDIWYLALIPNRPRKMVSPITGETYEITIPVVGDTESKASNAINLPTLIKLQEENEIKEQELTNYRKLLEKAQQRASTLNILLNKARHLLTQKIFVGYGRPLTPLQKASEIAWIVGAFFGGAYSYGEIPKYFPTLPAPVIAGAVFFIIIALREFVKKKSETVDDALAKEAEQSV